MSFIVIWSKGIIIVVIIATIIEMLLPNNGNGKYVKMVIGIFVLFSIISPVINKFRNNDKDLIESDYYIKNLDDKTVETANIQTNNEKAIKKMYEENLKIDIKSKISQKGYLTGDINVEILDNQEYTLNKIEFKVTDVKEKTVNSQNNSYNTTTIIENIENIKVDLGGSGKEQKQEEKSIISESEKRKLKEYLADVYAISEKNIFIS